jgi:hypothetical protein
MAKEIQIDNENLDGFRYLQTTLETETCLVGLSLLAWSSLLENVVAEVNMARTAEKVLEADFPIARARVLELAAILDRIEMGTKAVTDSPAQNVSDHPAMRRLRAILEMLNDEKPDKTRRIQEYLSRPYDPTWIETFEPTPRSN